MAHFNDVFAKMNAINKDRRDNKPDEQNLFRDKANAASRQSRKKLKDLRKKNPEEYKKKMDPKRQACSEDTL